MPTIVQDPRTALLLGVVFSKELNPKRGQGFRDRVRCEALENEGFIVKTLDNKHDEELARDGSHCRANFTDCKRMWRSLQSTWSINGVVPSFDTIILDYFFSPAGWVNTRWTEKFFSETLPFFVEKGLLKPDGSLWLPHVSHVESMINKHRDILSEFYEWEMVLDPNQNPLYSATDKATEELLRCPDNLTNATQLKPLEVCEGGPFYELKPLRGSPVRKRKGSPLSSKNSEGPETGKRRAAR